MLGCRGWGKLGPLAVPLAITLMMWLVGPISSMCINPARAFGPAVVTGSAPTLLPQTAEHLLGSCTHVPWSCGHLNCCHPLTDCPSAAAAACRLKAAAHARQLSWRWFWAEREAPAAVAEHCVVCPRMWEHHWIWWTAPFIGGPAAAVLYSRLFLPMKQSPQPYNIINKLK